MKLKELPTTVPHCAPNSLKNSSLSLSLSLSLLLPRNETPKRIIECPRTLPRLCKEIPSLLFRGRRFSQRKKGFNESQRLHPGYGTRSRKKERKKERRKEGGLAVDSAGIKTAGGRRRRRRRPPRRRHSGAAPSGGVFLRPRAGRGSERGGKKAGEGS